MRALVTGAAGFIGSTLAERLVAEGWSVRGVDAFTPYYDTEIKRANVAGLAARPEFELVEGDLLELPIEPLVADVDAVFYLAAQPGVRPSWAEGFAAYTRNNVDVTQRLLEAVRARPAVRVVNASSSSVYGRTEGWPTREDAPLAPHSPYGVTKLAAEHLCGAYASNFGIPAVSLRFFTVYGPRQRPDMAVHRLITAARTGRPFPLFGTGDQVRDFTYVDDVVEANLRAATTEVAPGSVINVAGGSSLRLVDLVDLVGTVVGSPVQLDWRAAQPGEVFRTGGATERAAELLGWSPQVSVDEGIRRHATWHRTHVPL